MTDRLDKNTPVYMIYLPEEPRSMYYMEKCKPRWESFGYEVILVDGITPEYLNTAVYKSFDGTIPYTDLINTPDIYTAYTTTMVASLMSHYLLWENLRRNNIEKAIIIEHDCYLNYDLPETVFDNNIFYFAQSTGFYCVQQDGDPPTLKEISARTTKACTGYAVTRGAINILYEGLENIFNSASKKVWYSLRSYMEWTGKSINPDYKGIVYPDLEDEKIGLKVPPEAYWNKTIFATELRDPLIGRTVVHPLPEVTNG